eukprot:2185894-Alexandrium_andersonii.AAC.1
MDDIDVADIEAFAGEGQAGPAWSESSDIRGASSEGQLFRGDITGAASPPDLVAAARSEEIRFMEFWGLWLSLIHISEPTRLALI